MYKVQEVANKVYTRYGSDEGNLEGLAHSIERWTRISFGEALKALEISRKNILKPKY